MVSLEDLNIESLPSKVSLREGWAASKHTLGCPVVYGEEKRGFIEYLLVSKQAGNGIPRLFHLEARSGASPADEAGGEKFDISTFKTDWLKPIKAGLLNSEPIDPAAIYGHFAVGTARTLLTGHYLATNHKKLIDLWKKGTGSPSQLDDLTQSYWQPLIAKAGGVTKLTVQIYRELLAWGETSTPSLISVLMNTGPRTIHTRLQEARKLKLLSKPGTGSRRPIKSLYEGKLEEFLE